MRLLPPALVLLLAFPAQGLAQVRHALDQGPPPPLAAPAFASAASPDRVQSQDEESPLLHSALRLAAGAAVGAWVGFMASQVAVGDWDDQHQSIDRGSWTAGGAAVGLALGITVPVGRGVPGRAETAPRRRDRDLLTTEQLRAAEGGSLYDIIRSLRPEWLRTRGTASIRETPRVTTGGQGFADIDVEPGIPTIKVYLDGSLLGTTNALKTVDTALVGQVRFLDPGQATHRFGAGHLHGAIIITTAPAG